ncbi:hypothetical protein M6I34_08690 [Burkholderiaceae bacterium FT117]|uniref:hypothetical protein n=1 Tax=Zeimonas sediminis TaxID=2944268 RepID=UPI002342D3E5|nr:hypothetical protein [Zeimonas sediminis]MCM5570584.1 hypothetical protein [Zeimonas sediminis]
MISNEPAAVAGEPVAGANETAVEASPGPGRVCPLRYRYGPRAIARAPERRARALYVVGGLYGNLPALDAVEAMARAEPGATICFNGDFNWFDVDDGAFAEVNARVLAHDATLGNVEAEFDAGADDAGCGCAYPDSVDSAIVDLFASTHTCLPALRRFALPGGAAGWIVNNGAAGMPNFRGRLHGLCVRIGESPSPHESLAEVQVAGAHVSLVPVRYAESLWQAAFLANWPEGSAAWLSYFDRIARGPGFEPHQALGPALPVSDRIAAGAPAGLP